MTYSIIDARDISGETISVHRTLEAAQAAWEKLMIVREWRSGQFEKRRSGRELRIRNDKTGHWAKDEIDQPLPPDAAELRQLITQGGYTQNGAAEALQISPRMMRYYCAGDKPVPRVVMLAMRHLVKCPPGQ